MTENILKPMAVGNLLEQEGENNPKYKFFIPSYQRGYRWDKEQVEDLLDDLFEFITTSDSKKEKYCLQPIVVKQLEDGKYEVLDGQQRLTTIHILLSRLKKNNSEIELFSLEYETRPNSAIFLKNIGKNSNSSNSENPDYFYISSAYVTIDNWLAGAKKRRANIQGKLFDAIVESIEFIWYQIMNDTDAIDVFTRINIGKIPLTNAELVKAVFLSKNNLSLGYVTSNIEDKDFSKILSLKQNAIALEWDQMEKVLQDPKVWGFIYGGTNEYETRIDYLLDLSSHKNVEDKNKYFSFKYFYDRVKNFRLSQKEITDTESSTAFIEKEWNDLKGNFDILLEWYNEKKFNHLIGFLISQNIAIIDVIEDFKINSRKDFLKNVKNRIIGIIGCNDISVLRYKKDNKTIERILLLHNVINSLEINDNNIHFPFERMKNKLWTLEHIFAQNSDELRQGDYFNWLEDHLDFFSTRKENQEAQLIKNNIKELLARKDKKVETDDFQMCFNKVSNFIQQELQNIEKDITNDNKDLIADQEEYDWISEDHSIANLALLDGGVNSAIKNSLFDIKRKLILKKDKEGLFIPSETKKVFLKYYTTTPTHLAYWTFEDRKAYIENIKSSINFLN